MKIHIILLMVSSTKKKKPGFTKGKHLSMKNITCVSCFIFSNFLKPIMSLLIVKYQMPSPDT